MEFNWSIRFLYHCRNPRRQSDVTSLITALDTTLKLSNVSVDRESPDVETPLEKYEEMEPQDVPYGENRTYAYLVPQQQPNNIFIFSLQIS